MRSLARWIVAGGLLVAAGCTPAMVGLPSVAPTDPQGVALHTTASHNPHTGVKEVKGPLIFTSGTILGDSYMIRSWIDPRNPAMHDTFQIYVTAYVRQWRFLDQAYANGEMLPTTVIDRSVVSCHGGCTMNETVGVNLTKKQMSEFAASGLSFQVRGKAGQATFHIPGAYFSGMLQVHERTKAT